MEIYTVCGMGMGSSLIAKLNVEKILKEANIEANVNYTDIGSITGRQADYYILTKELADNVPDTLKDKVIIVSNFINLDVMKIPILERLS
ncbi:PTS sugar transporter subunit IIB [Enterococcus sp. LJL90]